MVTILLAYYCPGRSIFLFFFFFFFCSFVLCFFCFLFCVFVRSFVCLANQVVSPKNGIWHYRVSTYLEAMLNAVNTASLSPFINL